MHKNFRSTLLTGALASLACAAPAHAGSAQALPIEIEAQPIAGALNLFVRQSGLQVLFPADQSVRSVVTHAVVGTLTPDAALTQLLASTGLAFEFVNDQTVAIRAWTDQDVSQSEGGGASEGGGVQSASPSRGIPEVLVQGKR